MSPLLEIKMKISARNQFSGTVKQVVKGPVSAEVTVTIAPGIDVVAVISHHFGKQSGSRHWQAGAGLDQSQQRFGRSRLACLG